MKSIRILPVLLLLIPTLCFADYKVVLKKNGKVIEGKYLGEDDRIVYLDQDGVKVYFKKELLDLEKMKELNVPQTQTQTQVVVEPIVSPEQAKLAELAAKKKAISEETDLNVINKEIQRLEKLAASYEEKIYDLKNANKDFTLAEAQLEQAKKNLEQYRKRLAELESGKKPQ